MKAYRLVVTLCVGFFLVINGLCEDSLKRDFLAKKVVISEIDTFLEGINKAKGFLYIGSYKLHNHLLPNPNITLALKKAGEKDDLKNKILVILENYLTQAEQKEGNADIHAGDSLKTYKSLGIDLIKSSSQFTATHYKLLISQDYAFVGTTNFDKNFEEKNEDGSITLTRDFSIILTEPNLIEELKHVVDTDRLENKSDMPLFDIEDINEGASRLSWGPEQHCHHFKQLIKKAKNSIQIYQQDLQDQELRDLLVEAVKRGVKVSILMSEFPFGIKNGNKSEESQRIIASTQSKDGLALGKIRLTGQLLNDGDLKNKRLHIHAKAMIIDGKIMYLGSANFYTKALHKDRNVGIITRNLEYVKPVQMQFEADWNAHKDLS